MKFFCFFLFTKRRFFLDVFDGGMRVWRGGHSGVIPAHGCIAGCGFVFILLPRSTIMLWLISAFWGP